MRNHLTLPGTPCHGLGRRLRLAVLSALVAGGIVSPSWAYGQATVTLEELAAAAVSAVVLIDVETPSGNRQGSGFLVDPGGRILTNSHVIRDARAARVKLASGDIYDMVTVLAEDERRDIAVLQVPGFELPTLPLGNSDSVRIGNPVVLIGSPLGLESTVTTGIISGRRQEPEGYQLLQISAPASRGSSGGPVLSQSGHVVAIASSQMQVGQNLNFAVPINYARGLLGHLGGEPLAVFMPPSTPPQELPVPMASADDLVNPGLRFALDSFVGQSVEMQARMGTDHLKRIRITFRLIETIGGGAPSLVLLACPLHNWCATSPVAGPVTAKHFFSLELEVSHARSNQNPVAFRPHRSHPCPGIRPDARVHGDHHSRGDPLWHGRHADHRRSPG